MGWYADLFYTVTLETPLSLEALRTLGDKFKDEKRQEEFFKTHPDQGFDTWCGCGNMQWIINPDSDNTILTCTPTMKRGSYEDLVNMGHYLLWTLGQGTLEGNIEGEDGYAWSNMEGEVFDVSLSYEEC